MKAPPISVTFKNRDDRYQLNDLDRIGIGKHPDNQICTGGHSTSVSRHHAVLSWSADQWWVRDLGSRYGTYVNDARVGSETLTAIASGDCIRVGDFEFRVHF